jgi:hypothetical protein
MREWQGRTYDVLVLDDGFSWQDTRYRSLSAIARQITGTAWSGPLFFGLRPNRSATRRYSPGDFFDAAGGLARHEQTLMWTSCLNPRDNLTPQAIGLATRLLALGDPLIQESCVERAQDRAETGCARGLMSLSTSTFIASADAAAVIACFHSFAFFKGTCASAVVDTLQPAACESEPGIGASAKRRAKARET